VGEKLVWETTHPEFSEITWERSTVGECPIQKTIHIGMGGHEYCAVKDDSQSSNDSNKPKKSKPTKTKIANDNEKKSKSKDKDKDHEAKPDANLDTALLEYVAEQEKKSKNDQDNDEKSKDEAAAMMQNLLTSWMPPC